MTDNRGKVEELSEQECLGLLRDHDLGRIAVVVDDRPQIFQVNYALDDEERSVAIRTAQSVKDNAPLTHVAFEVDEVDRAAGIAWSVLVEGVAEDVTNGIDRGSAAIRRLAIHPGAFDDRPRWLTISLDHVTGRRFRLTG